MFVDMSHVVLVVCSRVPLDFASRVWEWKKFYAPTLDQEGGQPTKGPGPPAGLEVLVVLRIALQIPIHSMSQSYHTVANRYELHRCRCTAYLLISFLQRLVSQDYGYVPRFFTSTRRLCCVKSCTSLLRIQDTFDHYEHASRTSMTSFRIQVTINRHASTSDFLHGAVHSTLEQLIR